MAKTKIFSNSLIKNGYLEIWTLASQHQHWQVFFFLMLSLRYQYTQVQILIFLQFLIYPFRSVSIAVLSKKLFEFLEASAHQCFKKRAAQNVFGNFQSKTFMLESFSSKLHTFLGVLPKAQQSSYYLENLLLPVSVKRSSIVDQIAGLFQSFENM